MKTDIQMVRERSKRLFDAFEVTPACAELGSLFISHPYTNSSFVGIYRNGKHEMINVYENEDDYLAWRQFTFDNIDKASLNKIWSIMINNPYLLTWLSFVKPYLSNKDFSIILGNIWVQQENPNCDVNVSIEKSIAWFKEANKKYLMSKEDYKIYESLPDKIEVFRGVSVGRNKMGLSYTRNKEKAEWFKKRFETEKKKGFLLRSIVDKKDILAYFDSRGEEEIVVDSLSINFEII